MDFSGNNNNGFMEKQHQKNQPLFKTEEKQQNEFAQDQSQLYSAVRSQMGKDFALTDTTINKKHDSAFMQAVKLDIKRLHEIEANPITFTKSKNGLVADGQLDELEHAYIAALESCKKYIADKDSSVFYSRDRYKMIAQTQAKLREELNLFYRVKKDMEENPDLYANKKGESAVFLNMAYEFKERETDPVGQLEVRDFVKMLSSKKVEGIICKDGKLLRKSDKDAGDNPSVPTRENYAMAVRFIDILLKNQNTVSDNAKAKMKRNLLLTLGVDLKKEVSGPVSILKIKQLLIESNKFYSQVDKTLIAGEKAAPQQKDLAERINKLLGSAFTKPGNMTEPQYTRKLKDQIRDVMSYCQKQQKQTSAVFKLRAGELDFLVAGQLQAVRDRVFESAMKIYDTRARFGNAKMAPLSDEDLKWMLGLAMSEVVGDSQSTRASMTVNINRFIESKSLDEGLKEDMKQLHNEAIIINSSENIREYVLRTPKKFDRLKSLEKQAGLAEMTKVIDAMKAINSLQTKGLQNGLTADEAAKLEKLAAGVDGIISSEEKMTSIRKILSNMPETSAPVSGFNELEEMIKGGKSLESVAKQVSKRLVDAKKEEKEEPKAQSQRAESFVLMSEVEAARKTVSTLDKKAQKVASIFLYDIKPSELIKKVGDANSKQIFALREALTKAGEFEQTVTLNGVKMKLCQKGEFLTLTVGKKTVELPGDAKHWINQIDEDIVAHFNKFPEDMAKQFLYNRADQDWTDDTASRSLYTSFLTYHLGINEDMTKNCPTDYLALVVKAYCEKGSSMTAETLKETIVSANAMQTVETYVNSQTVNESLVAMENAKRMREENGNKQEKKSPVVDLTIKKNEWGEPEQKCLDFIGNIVCCKEVGIQKGEQYSAARLKEVIKAHKDKFLVLVNNMILRGRMLSLAGANQESFKNVTGAISDIISAVVQSGKTSRMKGFLFFSAGESGEATEEEIMALLEDKAFEEKLAEAAVKLQQGVNGINEYMSKSIKDAVADIDVADDEDNWKTIDDMTSEEIVLKGMTGSQGEGAFNKAVLSTYIEKASAFDQQNMIASLFKNMPKVEIKDIKKLDMDALAGRLTAGYIKGAGPLLHKMLQGMPISNMDRTLQEAVKDVRSNLEKIDDKIVDATLENIIKESAGAIERIDKIKILGAASVGETVLVKVYSKGATEGTERVVKILRPGVANRMEREYAVMRECARQVDEEAYKAKQKKAHPDWKDSDIPPYTAEMKGAMEKTFDGKVEAIKKEFDLRLEADNVELGKIYEDPVTKIKSMRVDPVTKAMSNALVLEKAPGQPMDNFMSDKSKELDELYDKVSKTKDEDDGYGALLELQDFKEKLLEKQKLMTNLMAKWTEEALFGSGFFHGDLHAGNIMIDDIGLTVIDYGNASKLDTKEQSALLNMFASAARMNADHFIKNFKKILSKESQKLFDDNKEEMRSTVWKIIKKEDDANPASKLFAIVIELQKQGIEVPKGLYNFIQCLTRIVGTMTDYDSLLSKVDNKMDRLMDYSSMKDIKTNPGNYIIDAAKQNILERNKNNRKDTQAPSLEKTIENVTSSTDINIDGLMTYVTLRNKIKLPLVRNNPEMSRVMHVLNKIPVFEAVINGNEGEMRRTFNILNDRNLSVGQLKAFIQESLNMTYRPKEFADMLDSALYSVNDKDQLERMKNAHALANKAVAEAHAEFNKLYESKDTTREQLVSVYEKLLDGLKNASKEYMEKDSEKEFLDSYYDYQKVGYMDIETDPDLKYVVDGTGSQIEADKITITEEEEKKYIAPKRKAAFKRLQAAVNGLYPDEEIKAYPEKLAKLVANADTFKGMTGYFEKWMKDEASNGPLLRQAYDVLTAAREKEALSIDSKEVKAFVAAFLACVKKRAANFEAIEKKKNASDDSSDGVFSSLLKKHFRKVVGSLDGGGLTYLRTYELSQKEKDQKKRESIQRKTDARVKLYENLTSVKVNVLKDDLTRKLKAYSTALDNYNDQSYKEENKEEVLKKATDAFNMSMTKFMRAVVTKINYSSQERTNINSLLEKFQNETSSENMGILLKEISEYINDQFKDTWYTTEKEKDEHKKLADVFNVNAGIKGLFNKTNFNRFEPDDDGKNYTILDCLKDEKVTTMKWVG